MSIWEGLLLTVAVLVAVRTLVGMMRHRAATLVGEVQKQVDAHREREKDRQRRQRQQEMNNRAA